MRSRAGFSILAAFALVLAEGAGLAGEVLRLAAREQVESTKGSGEWQQREKELEWDAAKTAIVVCDMWDQHWCKGATERVAEMAPRMNEVVKAARAKGVFIIHAPSETMEFYKDTPQRKRAQSAPLAKPPVELKRWRHLDPEREAPLPIDDSDGGCDDWPQCETASPWKRQIPAIEIAEQDAITDSAEAYNLLQERGIENVIVMGVHANMCVLGRPFSIRQMVNVGKNVVLMRDMTDTMYNSRRKPYVSHFRGTDLIVSHIERYWCPSITSAAFLGGKAFRFSEDRKPTAVFLIGEDEYKTKETLPAFAAKELEWRGIESIFVHASEDQPHEFPGFEAVKNADILVVSVRRRALAREQLELIRAHLKAGKPLIGIRTASHAFEPRNGPSGRGEWANFDDEVLGGDYQGHYGKGPPTVVEIPQGSEKHPVLTGISDESLKFTSHLYKYPKLGPDVTLLLRGWVEGKKEQTEPVAWVNKVGEAKIFYTSLGSPEDFAVPEFQRMLLNAFLWATDLPIPPKQLNYGARWQIMEVPGTWEDNSNGQLAYDGTAWYRAYLKIPENWKGKDAELLIEKIDNAHEAYFNGLKIGGAGSFPPTYLNGDTISARYRIPASSLKAGQQNLLAVRVYDHEGRGGFKGRAPRLIWGEEMMDLAGPWQFRTGDNPEWATEIRKPDGAPEFSAVESAENLSSAVEQEGPLSPEESLKRFQIAEDLEIEQVLAEPVVRQPLHLSWDERGRLWVVQYIQYPAPAGLTLMSKDQFWRAVYDKVPPAPPNHFRGEDKITIHEDTDRDGIYDTHKTFIDGLNIATSVAHGRGGVWILNPPYLLFYSDENKDDLPDGDPVVHLAGFGLEDTHSVANSLCWGPDGWLYGAHGSTVTANIVRPGIDQEPIVRAMGQHIWRYHPETRRFEIFAEGGGNAFGIEMDDQGRVFSGHNGGNTRGFHYVQGGYLQKGFEKHGPLSNPYAFGYFRQMAHNDAERFTHTFVIYGGGALPEEYVGKLLGVEPLQGRVVLSDVQRDRSSFQTRDVGFPVVTSDKYFKPVDIKVGPDGAVYVADWYDRQVTHTRNYEGQIDKSNGRIYRLKAKGRKLNSITLANASNQELLKQLEHTNRWVRHTALRMIADRRDASLAPELRQRLAARTNAPGLESLGALYLSGGLDVEATLESLDHPDPHVRLWSVRFSGDAREVSPRLAEKMAALAASDPEVEVRSQLASTAKRLPVAQSLPVLRNLLTRSEDLNDIHVPLLIWWAIESKAEDHRDELLALFADQRLWQLPLVREHILERLMRRYAQAGTRRDLLTCAKLLDLAPGPEEKKRLMAGFEEAFKGRSMAGLPRELMQAIARAGGESLAMQLRRGDKQAFERARDIISDEKSSRKERVEYIVILGEVKYPSALWVLLQIATETRDETIRKAAFVALQIYDDPMIAASVTLLLPSLQGESQLAAFNLLTSRQTWSEHLLEAVKTGRVQKQIVPPEAVRKLRAHDALAARTTELFGGEDGVSSAAATQAIEKFTRVIHGGSGDPFEGYNHYQLACSSCHSLFGEGGQIGPDLTSYRRDDLETMLLHIVNPSAEIREGYENLLVETRDGRTISGFLADKDNQVVVLRGLDGQNVVLPRDQVVATKAAGGSLMPEGLLEAFNDQQIRDLFAYLRSTQPLVKRR